MADTKVSPDVESWKGAAALYRTATKERKERAERDEAAMLQKFIGDDDGKAGMELLEAVGMEIVIFSDGTDECFLGSNGVSKGRGTIRSIVTPSIDNFVEIVQKSASDDRKRVDSQDVVSYLRGELNSIAAKVIAGTELREDFRLRLVA